MYIGEVGKFRNNMKHNLMGGTEGTKEVVETRGGAYREAYNTEEQKWNTDEHYFQELVPL